jgi:hypothetical protein
MNTGRLSSFFRMARFVDDPDCLRLGMVTRDNPLDGVPQAVVIPLREREKFLQRPRRHAHVLCHGLDALAEKVAELPLHVLSEVATRVRREEAVVELAQEIHKPRRQSADLLNDHP